MRRETNLKQLIFPALLLITFSIPGLFDAPEYHRTELQPMTRDEVKRMAEKANASAYRNTTSHHRKTSMLTLEVRK